jgi:hypothetical protein
MKFLFLTVFFQFIFFPLHYAQTRTGCRLDSSQYAQVPLAEPLWRGNGKLPLSFSLKKYTPLPQNQGEYGTCVAWATAYMARSIMFAQKNNWTDRQKITQEAFSPYFVYQNIRTKEDKNCQEGADLVSALQALKSRGTLPVKEFPVECSNPQMPPEMLKKAQKYSITDYKKLFVYGSKDKVLAVKKSIADGKPAVLGVSCCLESFKNAKDSIWIPKTTDDTSKLNYWNGHAVCVVAYDDQLQAFEIMNSWGEKWANKGFIWVKYENFNDFCFEAYQMQIDEDKTISAKVTLILNNQKEIQLIKNDNSFKTKQLYKKGTLFNFRLNEIQAKYVYAFATDTTQNIVKLFGSEAVLKDDDLQIPSKKNFIQMSASKGTDYYVVLLSQEKLHFESILENLKETQGSLQQRLHKVLGSKLSFENEIQSSENKIISRTPQTSVLALVVGIGKK